MIKDRLDANPAVIQLPIGAEGGFRGVVDLLSERPRLGRGEGKGEMGEIEIPTEMKADAEDATSSSTCSHYDDVIMEVPRVEEITAEDLHRALRAATLERASVRCCAARRSEPKGVQPMLDAVSTTCPPRSTCPPPGHGPGKDEVLEGPATTTRPSHPRLQGDDGPLRRAHVPAGLLGPAQAAR